MKKKIIIYSPLLLLLVLLLITRCDTEAEKNAVDSNPSEQFESNLTPLEIVNERMRFFNAHNYDEFIKLYHKNVKVFTYPDKLMGTGSDRLASIFKTDFENKSVSVKIENQITNGPYVINHEIVTNDGKPTKYVSIYKIEKGLITNVSFVREF
ncbi:nuclear transport factor 2 family protein [Aquimarina sp. AU58]|uniref:nuclear transport factor 2 family protein n=1 Tax=Aquimarina sp. AU58 TaxID=1874112 RepID=UPI000D6DF3B2|nr:nuclear transport factor 2 family protein [Aquimarina sp. AU58]